MATPEQLNRQFSEANRQANVRLQEGRIHVPQRGELLANRQNHLDNLKMFSGRWHGTVFENGKPRIVTKKGAVKPLL